MLTQQYEVKDFSKLRRVKNISAAQLTEHLAPYDWELGEARLRTVGKAPSATKRGRMTRGEAQS